MGLQAYRDSVLFYVAHVGILVGLFLWAFFRPSALAMANRSTSIAHDSFSTASRPWLRPLAQMACAVVAFLLAILIQWWVYENFDWLELRYCLPIAFAAAFFWKRRSFWLVLLFYLLHYNASFDGPMAGATCTVVRSPDGNLAFVQERYLDKPMGNHSTGLDQIFGEYRGWGLMDCEGEIFGFGLDEKYLPYYRPRVTSRGISGEVQIRFGSNHFVTIHPDRTYVEYRDGKSRRDVLRKWSDKGDFGQGYELLISSLAKANGVQQFASHNDFRSFFLYLIYPVFFAIYWCRPHFRECFTNSGRFHLAQWALMILFYLLSGIPEPVYWPMWLMFLGWLRKQEAEAFYYIFSVLIALWVMALLACSASHGPVTWIWVYLIWMAFEIVCIGIRSGRSPTVDPQVGSVSEG